jgi:FkbM family methyltransferase
LYRYVFEKEYEGLKYLKLGDGEIVDIGANDGVSALQFRMFNKINSIVSIEPNQTYDLILNKLTKKIKDYRYIITSVGSKTGKSKLTIPYYKGTPCASCAAIGKENVILSLRKVGWDTVLDAFEFKDVDVQMTTIDNLNLKPAFMKIDVEGSEHDVLLGVERTIQTSGPILLIENHTPDRKRMVVDFLANYGYEEYGFDSESKMFYPRPEEDEHKNDFFFLRKHIDVQPDGLFS